MYGKMQPFIISGKKYDGILKAKRPAKFISRLRQSRCKSHDLLNKQTMKVVSGTQRGVVNLSITLCSRRIDPGWKLPEMYDF
jgi:hypothetical protein